MAPHGGRWPTGWLLMRLLSLLLSLSAASDSEDAPAQRTGQARHGKRRRHPKAGATWRAAPRSLNEGVGSRVSCCSVQLRPRVDCADCADQSCGVWPTRRQQPLARSVRQATLIRRAHCGRRGGWPAHAAAARRKSGRVTGLAARTAPSAGGSPGLRACAPACLPPTVRHDSRALVVASMCGCSWVDWLATSIHRTRADAEFRGLVSAVLALSSAVG